MFPISLAALCCSEPQLYAKSAFLMSVFFMYLEDIDITRRMHTEFRTVFYPGATVVHDHARQSYKSMRALWVHLYNLVRYFNKWGWIFDPQRSKVNWDTLKRLHQLPTTPHPDVSSAKEREGVWRTDTY